jgi:hypothetical protein
LRTIPKQGLPANHKIVTDIKRLVRENYPRYNKNGISSLGNKNISKCIHYFASKETCLSAEMTDRESFVIAKRNAGCKKETIGRLLKPIRATRCVRKKSPKV